MLKKQIKEKQLKQKKPYTLRCVAGDMNTLNAIAKREKTSRQFLIDIAIKNIIELYMGEKQ